MKVRHIANKQPYGVEGDLRKRIRKSKVPEEKKTNLGSCQNLKETKEKKSKLYFSDSGPRKEATQDEPHSGS